jgi:hypothetical protein
VSATAAGAFKIAHEAQSGAFDVAAGDPKRFHPAVEEIGGIRPARGKIAKFGNCQPEFGANAFELASVDAAKVVAALPPFAQAREECLHGLGDLGVWVTGHGPSSFCMGSARKRSKSRRGTGG